MIIEPDFFNHWKVLALVEMTGYPESPLWIQRLWAHCQTRRTDTFNLPTIALKVICGVTYKKLDPDRWFQILKECGFIEGEPGHWTVHDWGKHNAALVKNWINGDKPKTRKSTSGSSQTEANDKPNGSQPQAKKEPNRHLLQLGPSDGLDGLEGLDKKDTTRGVGPTQTSASERASEPFPEFPTAIDREIFRTLPDSLSALPDFREEWAGWVGYVSARNRGLPPTQTFDAHLRTLAACAARGGAPLVTESLRVAIARNLREPIAAEKIVLSDGPRSVPEPVSLYTQPLPAGIDPHQGGAYPQT